MGLFLSDRGPEGLVRKIQYGTSKTVSQLRFQVLMAASMKMAVFRVVAPCSLVEVYLGFRGTCYIHHQGDK
jgi:hypothetical protein